MKKSLLFFALFFVPALAFARQSIHQAHKSIHPAPAPAPSPVVPPPIVSTSSLTFGFFLPPSGVSSAYTMKFTDGAFLAGNNEVIFMEPPMNDAAVLAGKFDATLQSFSTSATKYSNIVLVLGEEENCVGNNDPWSVGYDGNTLASSIATIQHESLLAKEYDPNIKIAQDWNNGDCGGSAPLSSYYAGSAYVDIVMDDGFDFGGQTWAQVFDASLASLQTLGKPLWIGSEGVTSRDNQVAFIQATFAGAKEFGLQGVMYFNQSPFTLSSQALAAL